MKKAAFTIVAKNYTGLAKVLEQSFKTHSDADFFIFIADEFEPDNKPAENNILIAKEILDFKNEEWSDMSFKYNLVEFCTAIKPACFQYLFVKEGFNKVVYFDPDIFLFNSAEIIYSELDYTDFLLTPHILFPQTLFKGIYADYLFLVNGSFNLGFLALKNSTTTSVMLNWWRNRLVNQCFFDYEKGMATDQKWMNLLPAIFNSESWKISRNPGLNLAPWNYHERKLIKDQEKIFVVNRDPECDEFRVPLVFAHFSGYEYRNFWNNKVIHKDDNVALYSDIELISEIYAEQLKSSDFEKYIGLQYSYACFKNGKIISLIQRRIYRRLKSTDYNFMDPFDTAPGSFYDGLKKRGLVDHSAASADNVTNKNVQDFDKKLKKVNAIFRVIKSVIGIRRYSMMIRFFRRYFREENQAFLYEKSFEEKLW